MGKAVSLITDYSLTQLYDFAKSSSDADQCRRLSVNQCELV
ncbi:MAG: hypothetical protein AAF228_12075 [Pseudomonadota bacterium]